MLYVFYGPDSSPARSLAEVRRALDEDGALATNNVTFQARGTSPAEVIAACSTPPFLGANRLVILEGLAEVLAGKGKRGKKKQADPADGLGPWQALFDYLPELPPSTTLVLWMGIETAPAHVGARGQGETELSRAHRKICRAGSSRAASGRPA
jgi:hypothetical protein